MHILIISRSYPNKINKTSGNFIKNQVDALSKHNITIGVLGVYNVSILEVFKKKNFKELGWYNEQQKNINILGFLYLVIPKLHFINNKIKYLIGKRVFNKYIKKYGKPDLIHLHTFEPGLICIWAKKKYNIPFIVTEHTSLFQSKSYRTWHKNLALKVYSDSIYNIAVSKKSAVDLENRFLCKFSYLPNFVDTFGFKLKKNKTKKTFNFINVAYLNKNKNQKMLIDAFYKTFGNNENYQLTIVGKGREKNNLENQIIKLQTNNIRLYGYAEQEEISMLLQESDCFTLSSNFETFGLVIIEAMSCGLPVISTKCGGPESIIVNSKLGIICEKEDINKFSDAMKLIIKNNYDNKYIRNYAIENFSYEFLSLKLINIYLKLFIN